MGKVETVVIADIYPLNIVKELFKKDVVDEINIVGLLNEIDKLDERKAKILRFRYKDKKTLQECGEIIGLSRERIRQIQNKSFRLLRHPSRKKFYKNYSKEESLEKEEYYFELTKRNPKYAIIIKEGLYYTARNESAKILNNLLDYDVGSDGKCLIAGSTDIDPIIKALIFNEINYIIAKKNEIIFKQEFYNNDLYNTKKQATNSDIRSSNNQYNQDKIKKNKKTNNTSERIDELIQNMQSDVYNKKRSALSAVSKLSQNHAEKCLKTIPYLFKLLDDNGSQVRKHSLKAIFFLINYLYFDDDYTEKIKYISKNDSETYNRKIANKIIKKASLDNNQQVEINRNNNYYHTQQSVLKPYVKTNELEKTFGERCLNCYNRKDNNYEKCFECFSKNLIPIIENHCSNCLDPYDDYQKKKNYKYCYNCYLKLKQNMNFIDKYIAISYHYNYDSDLGFTLHTYKGSNMKNREWMAFPLQSLVFIFLIKNIKKIRELYNDIDSIIPIPGHAENLLIKEINDILPVKKILIDNRKKGRFSENTASREFSKERFFVKTKHVPNTIILFDDVYTSGSTANSAAFALKEKGVKNIILLTIARHLKNTQIKLLNEDVEFDINKSIL